MNEQTTDFQIEGVDFPDLYSNQQIVAHRRCGRAWPMSDAIKAARDAYDRGTHEMATKRFKGFDFLLLIKRKVPTVPRDNWGHLKGRRA